MNKVFFVKPPETFITKANRNKHLRSTVFFHVNFILQNRVFPDKNLEQAKRYTQSFLTRITFSRCWLSSVCTTQYQENLVPLRLHEYFPITEFFWSVFSHIRSEYGEKRSISPYSVRIRENTYQKKLRIWTLFT